MQTPHRKAREISHEGFEPKTFLMESGSARQLCHHATVQQKTTHMHTHAHSLIMIKEIYSATVAVSVVAIRL